MAALPCIPDELDCFSSDVGRPLIEHLRVSHEDVFCRVFFRATLSMVHFIRVGAAARAGRTGGGSAYQVLSALDIDACRQDSQHVYIQHQKCQLIDVALLAHVMAERDSAPIGTTA